MRNFKLFMIFSGLFLLLATVSLMSTVASKPEAKAIKKEAPLVPVLIYHRVCPKTASIYDFTPAELEKHFSFFKDNGYTPITASQLIEMLQRPELFPLKPVVLTFDDGHKSHYTRVFPLLKKYGFKATFFVYTDLIAEKGERRLTWNELLEMQREGMDIQSHTKSHPHLTKVRKHESEQAYWERLDRELSGSKQILERKLQRRVDLLAYPYGWFNSVVEKAAIQAGYRGMFTVNWGVNLPNQNPYRIRRRVMENSMNTDILESILTARPLSIAADYPQDAAIYTQTPEIKFKLPSSPLDQVEIKVRSFTDKLSRDEQGYFTWSGLKELKPGYHMIIIKGYDDQNQLYLGSWGFDFKYN